MDLSVEEIIVNPLKKFFVFDTIKFSSSGREDVDVRMLGRGRPFLLEVVNPRKTKFDPLEMETLATAINADTCKWVRVRDLQVVKKCVRFLELTVTPVVFVDLDSTAG